MINWTVVLQLTSLAVIGLAGPVIIVLLALRGGNL